MGETLCEIKNSNFINNKDLPCAIFKTNNTQKKTENHLITNKSLV